MIYVFDKNKIFSYVIACSFVLMLFTFHDSIVPKNDVELVKTSSNITENNFIININNNLNN